MSQLICGTTKFGSVVVDQATFNSQTPSVSVRMQCTYIRQNGLPGSYSEGDVALFTPIEATALKALGAAQ